MRYATYKALLSSTCFCSCRRSPSLLPFLKPAKYEIIGTATIRAITIKTRNHSDPPGAAKRKYIGLGFSKERSDPRNIEGETAFHPDF